MAQQFKQQRQQNEPENKAEEQVRKAPDTQEQGDALDAVLDDISSTLETDAEQYVSSFVQKGGE
ncbi:ubiquitin-like protein Pup [Bifidobacterium sp. ESL0775]|uniref:ubiquitin-like protein Pup n=1 Tax=Bifidobacterium sp. ESL0775 TaxID=2983230 RepID=UPI0023F98269|nr:ubiquitin-like protein Pup [Bifidobacterium sp. ESL0775]WEV69970.1 ubiquitin-like protein Pup [Bifidobacterium sp. ESL0775]